MLHVVSSRILIFLGFNAQATRRSGSGTNGDGAGPRAGLIMWCKFLYVTTAGGGSSSGGTLFHVLLLPTQLTIISAGVSVI
jgi:hypothetical protein